MERCKILSMKKRVTSVVLAGETTMTTGLGARPRYINAGFGEVQSHGSDVVYNGPQKLDRV